jgi:putative ABC transport system permease protein
MSLVTVALLHLKRKKLRTVLLVFSVALSLSMLIGVNAGVEGLETTYQNMVTDSLGYTDLIIKSNSTISNFDSVQIQTVLEDIEGVAAYSCRVQYWTPFVSKNGSFISSNTAAVVGVVPETDEKFGGYTIYSGNFNSILDALQNQPSSCVVSSNLASRLGLKPGDHLFLGGYNASETVPPQPSQVIELTVACVINDYGRAYWFDAENPDNFRAITADVITNLNVSQNLFLTPTTDINSVYLHVKDIENVEFVKANLQNAFGSDFSIANLKLNLLDSVMASLAGFSTIGYVIGGMALMISAMLLLNSMLANINDRRQEVGVMRAIGASRGQLFLQFLVETLPVAVVGAVASVPLSMLMAQFIVSVMPAIYVEHVGVASSVVFSYSLPNLLSGLALGVCITIATGLAPALIASRMQITQVSHPQMRSYRKNRKTRILTAVFGFVFMTTGPYMVYVGFSGSTSWVPNVFVLLGYASTLVGAVLVASLALPLLSKMFSLLLKPALGKASVIVHRNILLNFRRSVFAYSAFAISIALLVALSSLVTTASSYDLDIVKYGQGADVQVWVYAPPSFAGNLKTVEGIKNAAGVGYSGYAQNNMTFNGQSLHGKGIMMLGVDSTDYFAVSYGVRLTNTLNGMTPTEVFAALVNKSDNVILQDALAKNISAEVGDEVTWLFTNHTGTFEKKLHVIGTTDSVAGSSETIYNSVSEAGYYMALISFQDMVLFRDPTVGGSNVDAFYVSVDSSADMTQVADEITQLCQQHGYAPTVYTVEQRLAQTQNSYAQAETLALSITGFFIIIGATGIAAAMADIVYERKREIGLLFAVGLDRRQNFVIIAGEALLLSLIGTAVGFVSGFGLAFFTVQSIQWWSSIPAPSLVVSPLTLATAVAIITVSAVFSSVYPAHHVSKLNIVDAIRK